MAVAFDAVTTQAGASTNFNHTPVGTPTLAIFTAHLNNTTDTEITAVTYGGEAMTRKVWIDTVGATAPGASGKNSVEMWTKEGPLSGVRAVSITHGATAPAREVYALSTYTVSPTSGATGTPVTAYDGTNLATTAGLAIGSETGGMVVDALCTQEAEDHTADGGQTERWDLSDSTSHRGCGSTEPGATSVDLGWSWTTATRFAYAAIAIVPTAGAAQAPAAPTAASAVASGDTITLSFTDNTSGAAQHRAYIKRATEPTLWNWDGDLEAGETSYTFNWLSSTTAYTVGITAFDADAESAMATSSTEPEETGTVRLVSGSFL